MHHVEHLFSNFGCFSIVDVVATVVGEGCSADAVMAVVRPWVVARMQRELSYRCSSGSGRTMGSSTGCSSEEDVGQEGLAST